MDRARLDTDIFSEVLKGIERQVARRAKAYRRRFGRLSISVITVRELVKGLHKLPREDRVLRFLPGLRGVEVLPLHAAGAEIAGRIHADLERTRQPIGRADPRTVLHRRLYRTLIDLRSRVPTPSTRHRGPSGAATIGP